MSKTLTEIAQELKSADKKMQLIYAFNGTGKTRLSREMKELIAPKSEEGDEEEESTRQKFLYYNAFTEDLFYWDNDLEGNAKPKLKIQPNNFTYWLIKLLKDQGQDQNIKANFQRYSDSMIIPLFNESYTRKEVDKNGLKIDIQVPAFSEIIFSKLDTQTKNIPINLSERVENIKISKGEESNFIWSIFYTLLSHVISTLNTVEEEQRDADQFNELEYVFIDDPVSSLDENHLIQLAVDLSNLIKSAPNQLKFVITTHNPLFYNVLYNELNNKVCFILEKHGEESFSLNNTGGDSNRAFSYHLHIKNILNEAEGDKIERFHFMLLRNLYEKTASFLGYPRWSELLPKDIDGQNKEIDNPYYNRIIQFTSHNTLSNETIAEPTPQEKQTVKFLLNHLVENYSYWKEAQEENNAAN